MQYLSWQKWEWKEKGNGIALFALNVPLHGCNLLDTNRIERLHTNFQISATLSKKVLIFSPNCIHFLFNFKRSKSWSNMECSLVP